MRNLLKSLSAQNLPSLAVENEGQEGEITRDRDDQHVSTTRARADSMKLLRQPKLELDKRRSWHG